MSGGIYPHAFKNQEGKDAFNRNDRVSLLLYSQDPTLQDNYRTKEMKKILKGKQIKEKGGIKPSHNFNQNSMDAILTQGLSPETSYLEGIVVSNKYKSPIKQYLRDLDEMVYDNTSPDTHKTIQVPSKAELLETPNPVERILTKRSDRGLSSNNASRGLRVGNAEREEIPFLQVHSSQEKLKETGRLMRVEKEVFNSMLKEKKSHLKSQSENIYKSVDYHVKPLSNP